jgi:hypothetical protein
VLRLRTAALRRRTKILASREDSDGYTNSDHGIDGEIEFKA